MNKQKCVSKTALSTNSPGHIQDEKPRENYFLTRNESHAASIKYMTTVLTGG